MAETERTTRKVTSAAPRVLKEPKSPISKTKNVEGSTRAQAVDKASARSRQVIDDVAHEHGEALKRLVNR